MKLTVVDVTTSATLVAAANPTRRYLALINMGTGLANVGLDSSVTIGAGLPLAAAPAEGDQGGAYSWEGPPCPSGVIYAIGSAATKICVLEG